MSCFLDIDLLYRSIGRSVVNRVGDIPIRDEKSLLIGRPNNINEESQVIKDGPSCYRGVPFTASEDMVKYARLELTAAILSGCPKLTPIV